MPGSATRRTNRGRGSYQSTKSRADQLFGAKSGSNRRQGGASRLKMTEVSSSACSLQNGWRGEFIRRSWLIDARCP